MNEEYNEHSGLLGGKGFYIALMLCVSVIALSAWMIVNNGRGEDPIEQVSVTTTPDVYYNASGWDTEPEPTEVILQEIPDVAEIFEPVPTQEPVAEVIAEVTPPALEVISPVQRSYVWPVIGEVDADYSMDALLYNETMGDWRTHDGIDIAAAVGEYVRAACAGTVVEVYEDVLYGTTVVMDHGDGLMSYYANLMAEPVVNVGDELLAGDILGGVGETALCETAQTPHLHFAMSLDDKSIDPHDYMPIL